MLDTLTPEEITDSLIIEQNNKKYLLVIKCQGEKLDLNLSEQKELGNRIFVKKLTLKGIKEINNSFLGLNSCNEFANILKNLLERKKISIIEKDDKLIINLNIEYFFKNLSIDIILSPEKKNSDEISDIFFKESSSIKELKNAIENLNKELSSLKELKNENKELTNKIENLNKEISSLKNENKDFKNTTYFLNLCWPIGSYYWTNQKTSPEILFGGKWQKIEGKFIYAADNNRKVDSTGGQEKVTLSIKEMPIHNHNLLISGCISYRFKEFNGVCSNGYESSSYILNQYGYEDNNTTYAGESQSHENMPPYIAAFCW